MKNIYSIKMSGTLLVIISFLILGVSTIYYKLINMVPTLEILSHMVVWSMSFSEVLFTEVRSRLYNTLELENNHLLNLLIFV